MQNNKFLLFVPQLPSSPSSPRVKVWRDLRAAGAISLQNGIWILTNTPAHEKLLQNLLSYVEKNNGTANIMSTEPHSPAEQEKIIRQFHKERQEEYEEFIEHCEKFLDELQREITKNKFSYGELEESENNLKRLEKWYKAIQDRDHLKEPSFEKAKKILENCQLTLNNFTEQIYAQESLDEHHIIDHQNNEK